MVAVKCSSLLRTRCRGTVNAWMPCKAEMSQADFPTCPCQHVSALLCTPVPAVYRDWYHSVPVSLVIFMTCFTQASILGGLVAESGGAGGILRSMGKILLMRTDQISLGEKLSSQLCGWLWCHQASPLARRGLCMFTSVQDCCLSTKRLWPPSSLLSHLLRSPCARWGV